MKLILSKPKTQALRRQICYIHQSNKGNEVEHFVLSIYYFLVISTWPRFTVKKLPPFANENFFFDGVRGWWCSGNTVHAIQIKDLFYQTASSSVMYFSVTFWGFSFTIKDGQEHTFPSSHFSLFWALFRSGAHTHEYWRRSRGAETSRREYVLLPILYCSNKSTKNTLRNTSWMTKQSGPTDNCSLTSLYRGQTTETVRGWHFVIIESLHKNIGSILEIGWYIMISFMQIVYIPFRICFSLNACIHEFKKIT